MCAGSMARRPTGNANFAWVQHMIYHLAPSWRRRLRARQRLHVLKSVRRRRNPQGNRRGRPGGLHGRPARAAFLLDTDSRLPLVPGSEQGQRQISRPPRDKPSSSTPAKWATWSTAPTANCRTRKSLASPDLPRLARRKRLQAIIDDVLGLLQKCHAEEIAAHGYVLTPGRYVGAKRIKKTTASRSTRKWPD